MERRSFLRYMISLAVAGSSGFVAPVRDAGAMGDLPVKEGMHRVKGEVTVNGTRATKGTAVSPNDLIATGPKSMAVFVVGDNAFLLREKSRLQLQGSHAEGGRTLLTALGMNTGALLSVFGKGKKEVKTTTAVCGIRGTGIYIEAEPDRTYICTCYGEVDIAAAASPGIREAIKADHHESPRYVYAMGAKELIAPAGMLNHTDDELTMLESLLRRRPPFANAPLSGRSDRY